MKQDISRGTYVQCYNMVNIPVSKARAKAKLSINSITFPTYSANHNNTIAYIHVEWDEMFSTIWSLSQDLKRPCDVLKYVLNKGYVLN